MRSDVLVPIQADEEIEERLWDTLSMAQQGAARFLRFSKGSWNSNSKLPFKRPWSSLTGEEKNAADLLNFGPLNFEEKSVETNVSPPNRKLQREVYDLLSDPPYEQLPTGKRKRIPRAREPGFTDSEFGEPYTYPENHPDHPSKRPTIASTMAALKMFEVERIVAKLIRPDGTVFYEVKWVGYEETNLEPANHPDLLYFFGNYEAKLAAENMARVNQETATALHMDDQRETTLNSRVVMGETSDESSDSDNDRDDDYLPSGAK
jgi:hypothetical protein